MPKILSILHDKVPETDRGTHHLRSKGFEITEIRPFLGEDIPELDDTVAGVKIHGGPQMVTDPDAFPFLESEIAFARDVIDRDIPLLGICLGGQIVARALDAGVDYHPENKVALGYYNLEPTEAGLEWFPEDFTVLAGNAQGFDLPSGATLLLRGGIFPNQAFRYGDRTMAFQFHPEVTRPILDIWQQALDDTFRKPGAQSQEEQDAGFERHNGALGEWYFGFLDRFFRSP